jgi:hypothetical protein
MFNSDFSLYGMTTGVLQLVPSLEVGCGVICGGWPSWVMGAETRGYSVKYVFVKSNVWTPWMRTWFPKAALIEYTEHFDWSSVDNNIMVWISDVAPPRKLKLWETSARFIISCRRIRHVPSPTTWTMTPLQLAHSSCGGDYLHLL